MLPLVDLPLAQLRGRQRRDAARLRRVLGGDVLRRDLPPAGGGLQRGRGGADAAADHRDHVHAVAALGRAVGPHRPAAADGHRADRGRRGAGLDGAARHRRRLLDRPVPGRGAVRARAVDDGGAADQHGARRGPAAQRRRGQRRQQRDLARRGAAGDRGGRARWWRRSSARRWTSELAGRSLDPAARAAVRGGQGAAAVGRRAGAAGARRAGRGGVRARLPGRPRRRRRR